MMASDGPRPIPGNRSRAQALVSVVAPAWNEADVLPHFIGEVRRVLAEQGCKFEIVIAENGSSGRCRILRVSLRIFASSAV